MRFRVRLHRRFLGFGWEFCGDHGSLKSGEESVVKFYSGHQEYLNKCLSLETQDIIHNIFKKCLNTQQRRSSKYSGLQPSN